MVSKAGIRMSVEISLIAIIQHFLSDFIIAINKSHCKWQYHPFSRAVIHTSTEFIVFSMIQGVSRDWRIDNGKSNLNRLFPWCLQLESPWVLKSALLPSFNIFCLISSLPSISLIASDNILHFLVLLSKWELNSSFSPWSKEWVEIEALTSERVTAIDVLHGV